MKVIFSQCITSHLLTLISSVISLLSIMRLVHHSSHPAYAFSILNNSVSLHIKLPFSSPPSHNFFASKSLRCWWFLAGKNYSSPCPLIPIFSPSNSEECLPYDNSISLMLLITFWKFKLVSLNQHCPNNPRLLQRIAIVLQSMAFFYKSCSDYSSIYLFTLLSTSYL